MSIDERKKEFCKHNEIRMGTQGWRSYVTSVGFSGHSLVDDTKAMLVASGNWVGSMSGSLSSLFSQPLLRWHYKPGGRDDYWTVPEIKLVAGDKVSIEVMAPSSSHHYKSYLFDYQTEDTNDPTRCALMFYPNGDIFSRGLSNIQMDGRDFSNFPWDGLTHVISATVISDCSISAVYTNFMLDSFLTFSACNFSITAASGNRFYPVDGGWLENPKITDKLNPQSSRPELWASGDVVADGSLGSRYGTITEVRPSPVVIGKTYEVSFNYDISSGKLQLICGNTGPSFKFGAGRHSIILENVTSSVLKVRQVLPNSVGSITNISVKEYTHGTTHNFKESRWVKSSV